MTLTLPQIKDMVKQNEKVNFPRPYGRGINCFKLRLSKEFFHPTTSRSGYSRQGSINTGKKKLIIQCDFDGTVTEEDEAFVLLDKFANGDWRQWLDLYHENKISASEFNSRAFAMVSSNKQSMTDFVLSTKKMRPGFKELTKFCSEKGTRFAIVSNGLDFYIDAVLKSIGVPGIEVFAARTRFNPGGIDVKYIGPDGSILDGGFKESYTRFFLGQHYRLIYIGNSPSDLPSVRLAHRVFATDQLPALCSKANISCTEFRDFIDIVNYLKSC